MPSPWAAGARVRIIGRLHGQQTVNVVHFATNTTIADDSQLDTLLNQLASAMLECILTTLLPGVSSDWSIDRVEAQRIAPAVSDPVVATATTGSVGERGPTSVSFQSALLHLRTGSGGKSGRGRMFLPPPGEADITNSAIDDATITLLVAFAACVASKFGGSSAETDWRIGVLSRKNLAATLGTFDNSFRQVTQLVPEKQMAVLSSRKVGKGS